jgi:radical SAM superfamily enzyme YgiQ (UPF0313 family)
MRILLIQSYLGRREPPVAPLGLATLAAQVKGHDIRIFDPNVAANPQADTVSVIEDFSPEFIAFSLRNIDTTKYSDQFLYFTHFQKYVKTIRSFKPDAALAVGGSGFSLFPRRIMELMPEIDFGFYLEAEMSFPTFLNDSEKPENVLGLYYRTENMVLTAVPPLQANINTLMPPAWDLVDLAPYLPFTDRASIGVETKRGCALHCSYCTYPRLSGSSVRQKEPFRVVDELTILKEKHGVNRVFFCDPVFNYPLAHASAICREILDRKLDIHWSAYHQDRFLTEEYVDLALSAGCVDFYFSPDAASSDGLKIVNKRSTLQSLHKSLEIIRANKNAKASYNFFAALPGVGWKNSLAAIRFLLKARLKLGKRLTRWKLSYIRLEPDTELAQRIPGIEVDRDRFLPLNSKQFNRMFYKKSTSFLLNIILSLHFYWGKVFGRKNILRN